MVLTHADSDHCSGLPVVVREIPVGTFLDGPSATQQKPEPTATDYLALRREVARFGIPDRKPVPGDRYPLGQGTFTILAPSQPPLPGDNDNAIVAMVEWGRTRILLTADVEALTEQRLLERGADLHCTVLKVGHHGSKTSTTDAFLKAAAPKDAVLSCGKYNPFGHPSAEVLHRLDAAGIPVYRTDVNGSVSFTCDDAGNCSAETFR
jgi:competence protein ComEC